MCTALLFRRWEQKKVLFSFAVRASRRCNTRGGVLEKLLDEKLASPDTVSRSQSEAAVTFANGNAAMDICGPWELPGFEKNAKFKWRVALLSAEKAGGIQASALGEQNHAILRSAKNPAIAFQFLEYRYGQGARSWNEFGMLPPSSDLITKDPKWPQAFQVFSEQMKYARTRLGRKSPKPFTWRCKRS